MGLQGNVKRYECSSQARSFFLGKTKYRQHHSNDGQFQVQIKQQPIFQVKQLIELAIEATTTIVWTAVGVFKITAGVYSFYF